MTTLVLSASMLLAPVGGDTRAFDIAAIHDDFDGRSCAEGLHTGPGTACD